MNQLTEIYRIRFSKMQINTFDKLKSKYKVDPNWFIRQAVAEKLKRDYPTLKESISIKLPF